MKPHLTALEAAYQLHYYLWLKTHYLQPLLATEERQSLARTIINEVCGRNNYNLLEMTSIQLIYVSWSLFSLGTPFPMRSNS
jgi:hypothetical protein